MNNANVINVGGEDHPIEDTWARTEIGKLKKRFTNNAALISETSLIIGDVVETLGYYASSDGGGGVYSIDGSAKDTLSIELDNGLFANLIRDPKFINVAQYGVLPSVADNSDRLQLIINTFGIQNTYYFPAGTYDFEKTVIISKAFTKFVGEKRTVLRKKGNTASGYSCTFNNTTYDVTSQNILFIIGPNNNAVTNVYLHGVEFDGITFNVSGITTAEALYFVGCGYPEIKDCYIYAYQNGVDIHASFGLNIIGTKILSATQYAIQVAGSTHMYACNCSFESVGAYPMLACFSSNMNVANCILNSSRVLCSGEGSRLQLTNCQSEATRSSLFAAGGGILTAINCIFERHQDLTYGVGEPIILCTDGGEIYANGCKFYFQNYSGEATWESIMQYSTNTGSKIVILDSTFEDFPTFTHYDGGASFVTIEDNFANSRKISGTATASEKVSITGQTIRKINRVAFFTITFKVTTALSGYNKILTLPTGFGIDGTTQIIINVLRGHTAYAGYISGNDVYTYENIPVNTECAITATYLCH